jgi:hypothetical protein
MSKQKSSTLPGSVVTVGLDIGYGVAKAITDHTVIIFPSVMGHAREIKFQQAEITARYPGDQIIDDDGEWFVGELALSQLPPGELLRLRGRTANESTMGNAFRLRLAKVAIGKLMQGMWNRDIVHIRIATGLPTDHMRDAAELKASLLGQHLIKTDTADIIANVTEVMVMPQPYGTIYAATLTETGEINRPPTGERVSVMWGHTRLIWRWMMKGNSWMPKAAASKVVSIPRRNAFRRHWNGTTARRCRSRLSKKF